MSGVISTDDLLTILKENAEIQNAEPYDYIKENAAFFQTLAGLGVSALSMCLFCLYRSRITEFKCFCLKCIRKPLSEEALANMENLEVMQPTSRTIAENV